ncbi:MAG: hypothetical protein ABI557_15070, partial [Aureliella sp.]
MIAPVEWCVPGLAQTAGQWQHQPAMSTESVYDYDSFIFHHIGHPVHLVLGYHRVNLSNMVANMVIANRSKLRELKSACRIMSFAFTIF